MDLHTEGRGLIYIFTGDGKGKTSAALGVAMRAAGQGKRAAMVQWYKEKSKIPASPAGRKNQKSKIPTWQIGEHRLPELLKESLFEIYPMGQGFYKLPTDHATPDEHRLAARKALLLAKRLIAPQPSALGPWPLFLLVLDEALNAVADGLISQTGLIRLIRQRNATHIILTGRSAPKKLVDLADLVTEMKSIKHPYDRGEKAVPGLDY